MFRSATDPYLKADSVAGIKAGRTVWGEGIVLSGTTPDAIDDSTHARTATAGANQTWATWPVEFGSGQPWKVPQTEPTTYFMLAEMHWLWTMKCWKHDATHDGKLTCKHEGCDGLLPEEPCQPVDVRLAVSRDSIVSKPLSRTTNYKPYLIRSCCCTALHKTELDAGGGWTLCRNVRPGRQAGAHPSRSRGVVVQPGGLGEPVAAADS